MNKIVASAGMLIVGVSGLQAANVIGLTPQQTAKWWSISASLRGFYDDNVLQTHKKSSSPGVEINPEVGFNMPLEQTLVSAKYSFLLNYFSDRPDESTDHHHEFDARINHRFSERYRLNVEDSFVYSNEPEVIDQGGTFTGFTRTDSSAFRNRIPIDLSVRLTPLLGLNVGYQNNYYDYEQDNTDLGTGSGSGFGSRSALLDRVEHWGHAEGQMYLTDTTAAFAGYRFGWVDYTSDDLLRPLTGPADPGLRGTDRSLYSHAVFAGVSHKFNQQLSGVGRVGIEYTDYYDQDETDVSPYVDLSAEYTYLPGSKVNVGVKVEHAPTDLVGSDIGDITRDQLATSLFATLTHRITPRITGQLYGRYQHSIFNGGEFDGESEGYLNSSISLSYQLDNNVAASVAYAFDNLWSDISSSSTGNLSRSFNRNRIWAGVTVLY